eukprot:890610-Prorocentrum_minimum.AAC.4
MSTAPCIPDEGVLHHLYLLLHRTFPSFLVHGEAKVVHASVAGQLRVSCGSSVFLAYRSRTLPRSRYLNPNTSPFPSRTVSQRLVTYPSMVNLRAHCSSCGMCSRGSEDYETFKKKQYVGTRGLYSSHLAANTFCFAASGGLAKGNHMD